MKCAARCPSFRPDVTQEIDLMKKLPGYYDYNKIPNPDYIHIPRPEQLPFREQFLTRVREGCPVIGLSRDLCQLPVA